ncbi:MAG TPA: carboxypeptidase-like regulatory domain-containing protein [Vicinamibacterales bacterium]|jgi:hypothetical protein
MFRAALVAAIIVVFAAAAESQVSVVRPGDGLRDPALDAKGTAIVRGRITSLESGKPLRRAQIRLNTAGEAGTPRTTSTGTDGRYELRDIPAGRYTLRVERSGYLPLNYGQRRPGEQGKPLELADKEVAEKIDFALPRMGVISGRVLDEVGEPISGVTVWALQVRYFQGQRKLVPTAGNIRTDDAGQYRLLALTPGDYVVMGSSRDTWPLDSDPKQVLGYAPTYFPGTPTPSEAQRVKIGVGQEVPNVDFSLVPGRTAKLSGTASSVSGAPLAGETVTLTQEVSGPSMSMASSVASAKVAGDGSWTIPNVSAGEYRLSVRTPARENQPAQEAQITVNVASADLDGLQLVAGAGGIVRGQIVTDDGSPLPAGYERILVRPRFVIGGRMMASVVSPDNGRVRSDGTFEVHGVLSDTVLSVSPLTAEWTLKAIEVEGKDVADQPMPIEPGGTLSGVRVVLTNRPTTIAGAVRDEKQNPAEGTVIAFAEDSAKWRDGTRMIRATRPDQRGRFSFKGLPAGEYLLIALDYVLEGQWNDPEFLDGLKGRAERVALADAETKQLDLVLQK